MQHLTLQGYQTSESSGNSAGVTLNTSRGDISCVFHHRQGNRGGVIWVCGALGGLDGPSFGIFATLSDELVEHGVSCLRLHYRYPGDLRNCVRDVLLGVDFLKTQGIERVVLAGHSFGGAVVITAAATSPDVVGVVTLSSQTYGADGVAGVAPRPLLLIHGSRDRNLPVECSELLYEWAREPKELVIYQGSGHFLRECHDELHNLLKDWLVDKTG
ncbi:MAG: alpha/beta hydrolase [Chloroflexota bacterium]|nr:alpha/beta hydrolase [Chloroflexota bacterium]